MTLSGRGFARGCIVGVFADIAVNGAAGYEARESGVAGEVGAMREFNTTSCFALTGGSLGVMTALWLNHHQL